MPKPKQIDNTQPSDFGRIFAQIAAQQGSGGHSNPIMDAIVAQSVGGGSGGGGQVIGGLGAYRQDPRIPGPVGAGGIINAQGQLARGFLGGWNDNMWANLPNFGIGYD